MPSEHLLSLYYKALNVANIVAITDAAGKITHANENFCKISGYGSDELIGQDHRLLNSGHHPKSFFLEMWGQISSGLVWRGQIKNKAKNGTCYWVDTTIVPLRGDEGPPIAYLSIRHDITPHIERTEKIRKQHQQMGRAARLAGIGELVGTLAHEIMNPLVVVQGAGERLADLATQVPIDPKALESLSQRLLRSAARIQDLIKNVRAAARDSTEEPMVSTNIQSLIQDVLLFTEPRFKRHDIRVEFKEAPIHLPCRPTQIAQIIINLLNNSCDSINSLPEKWIRIEFSRPDLDALEISVTDSGPALPPEMAKKLGTPFFTTKPLGEGIGTGLSLSIKIARQHGGDLRYDASSPHARFVLRLPLKSEPVSSSSAKQ